VSTTPSIHVGFSAVDPHNYIQPFPAPISRNSSISSTLSGSSFSSSSHSEKSPPRRISRLPPLSRFFPSRHTSLDDQQSSTRTFVEYDHSQDDTSAEETPRPDQVTPRILTAGQSSTPLFLLYHYLLACSQPLLRPVQVPNTNHHLRHKRHLVSHTLIDHLGNCIISQALIQHHCTPDQSSPRVKMAHLSRSPFSELLVRDHSVASGSLVTFLGHWNI
jgi:hypothetical protein